MPTFSRANSPARSLLTRAAAGLDTVSTKRNNRPLVFPSRYGGREEVVRNETG